MLTSYLVGLRQSVGYKPTVHQESSFTAGLFGEDNIFVVFFDISSSKIETHSYSE